MEQDNRERIVRLEQRSDYERERIDYHLTGLHHRLHRVETRPSTMERMTKVAGGPLLPLLKIAFAVGLTLFALLFTGDPRKAAAFLGLLSF